MRHIIWDWNGTLLDDLPLVVESVNVVLGELGARRIDEGDYRDHYTRPVYRFYERILGRPVAAEEWVGLDTAFHSAYGQRAVQAPLAVDGAQALEMVARSGATQSLLSMLPHHDLIPAVQRHRVDERMVVVDGLRAGRGDRKGPHLIQHIARLRAALGQVDAGACAMIGDSLDDALAARAAGVACVLYDGGAHHRAELERAGVPVASSLLEALQLVFDPAL